MANKALATRQKMRLRVEPTPPIKPRNPFAGFAKARAARSREKTTASERVAGFDRRRRLDAQPHLLPGCQCLVAIAASFRPVPTLQHVARRAFVDRQHHQAVA
ncbi:hypothetical protein [Massilia phosphatilytica]